MLQTIAWAVALPLIFPMTALLTRYLGPVRYGEYSLTFPFFTVFALLSGTGMDALLVRQLSTQPRPIWGKTLGGAIATRTISTCISIMAACAIALFLPVDVEQRTLFLVGSVSLLFSFSFNGVRIVYTHGFRAEQRIGLLCLIETLNRLVSAALVAVIVLLHFSLLWAYVLLVYSDLPAFCWLLFVAQHRFHIRIHMKRRYIRSYLLDSLPLVGHNALSLLAGQVDLLLLMVFMGPLTTGLYALASRITDPLISIVLAYTNGFYPLFCRAHTQDAHAFALSYYNAIRLLALMIAPIATIIILAAPVIVHVLAGSQFASAAIVVQLLMGAMALTFLSQVAEKACVAAHLEKHLLPVTSLALFANIVMNVCLIPRWSLFGAAIASLVTEALTLCFYLFLLRFSVRTIPLSSSIRMVIFVVANALTLFVFSSWAISLYFRLPLMFVFILVYALLTRTFTWQDLRDLKTILYGGNIAYAHSF
jgi:O-antigen/teichoic acid export membrane protein